VSSERCSIEEQSIEYCVWACCCESPSSCRIVLVITVDQFIVSVITVSRFILEIWICIQLWSLTRVSKCSSVPRIFFGWGVQQIQLSTEGRQNGDLGAVAP
jgi:hypothetical protein